MAVTEFVSEEANVITGFVSEKAMVITEFISDVNCCCGEEITNTANTSTPITLPRIQSIIWQTTRRTAIRDSGNVKLTPLFAKFHSTYSVTVWHTTNIVPGHVSGHNAEAFRLTREAQQVRSAADPTLIWLEDFAHFVVSGNIAPMSDNSVCVCVCVCVSAQSCKKQNKKFRVSFTITRTV